MSATPNILAENSVVKLGNHDFKIIKKAGNSGKGKAVWEAHLMKDGVPNPENAFIIKYDVLYNPVFSSKADFDRCQKDAEKQSEFYESAAYWLDNHIVILMPKLPGQPLLTISGEPVHPGLAELILSERLELAALIIRTYSEFHGKGFVHIDLNPGNLLIAIKKVNGKAYFQVNILDFVDTISTPMFTAPENRFSSIPHRNVKSDIYLQTPIIAVVLGESNVFYYKWARMRGSSLELESEVEKAPFCLIGMQSYLIEELLKLQNTQFPIGEIAKFIQVGMKSYLTQELFEWGKMNLSNERLFEIVSNARNLYLTHQINGMRDDSNPTMKSYLIKALCEAPENTLSPEEITQFINNSPMVGFLDDELFVWTDVVNSVITRMGSNNPKDRPEEAMLFAIFNHASLVCREREMALSEKEGALITPVMEQGDAHSPIIPVKNHLLVECGIFVRVHQKIIKKARELNSNTGNLILLNVERITKEDDALFLVKTEAKKAIDRAAGRNQSFLGFFCGDNSKIYQDIINIIEKFEQQRKMGVAILEKTDNRDFDNCKQIRGLAQELIVGNGSEETIRQLQHRAQAAIEKSEKPGAEIGHAILAIIDEYKAKSPEDIYSQSTPDPFRL